MGVHVGQQRDHADEAGDGEDVDRGGRFFADVDFLVGDVVEYCQGGSDTDPTREEEAWILKAAGEVEDVGGYVGVDGVDREKADHGGLGGVVDEPSGHQAIRKEERQVPRGKAPYGCQTGLRQRIASISVDAQRGLPSADDNHDLRAGQHAEQQLEGRGQPPPQGGQDGDEAEGEEPRVPRRGHLEDDGDAGLEEGRVHGVFGGRGGSCRGDRDRVGRVSMRVRSKLRWRKMAGGRAPSKRGGIGHLSRRSGHRVWAKGGREFEAQKNFPRKREIGGGQNKEAGQARKGIMGFVMASKEERSCGQGGGGPFAAGPAHRGGNCRMRLGPWAIVAGGWR